jgi:hypothetical protein
MTTRDQIVERIRANERAIEHAEWMERRIDRTIRESAKRSEQRRKILRRAGYLRDAT